MSSRNNGVEGRERASFTRVQVHVHVRVHANERGRCTVMYELNLPCFLIKISYSLLYMYIFLILVFVFEHCICNATVVHIQSCILYMYTHLHGLVLGEDSDVIARAPGSTGDHVGHLQVDITCHPTLQIDAH